MNKQLTTIPESAAQWQRACARVSAMTPRIEDYVRNLSEAARNMSACALTINQLAENLAKAAAKLR